MSADKIRVFACESEPLVVEGLKRMLEPFEEFEFSGAGAAPAESLEAISAERPELVLVDCDSTGDSLLSLLAGIRSASAESQPVLWMREAGDVEAACAMELGARAVVEKTQPIETLLECLRAVAAGQIWTPPGEADSGAPRPGDRRAARLTPRERQIVRLLAQGRKNSEIAEALGISPGTVKVHLTHIFEKTGTRDRFELALLTRRLLGPNGDSD